MALPESEPSTRFAQTPDEPFDYKILTGHKLPDGSYRSDEELRMEYITLTDGLIYKMTDGVEFEDPATGEKKKQTPDVVVWLDKSARPLAWLTKELWPVLAADPATGEVPTMPEFKFVNIDREQWVNRLDPEGAGSVDIARIDRSIIRSLRSIFVTPTHKKEGLTPAVDAAPSSLDGKAVLIVDETKSEGKTLKYAREFFKAAFPTAKVAGAYWTTRKYITADGEKNDIPVWYREDTVYGRGVGNRDDRKSQRSPNLTQRLGSWFLSTRLPENDESSRQLRLELKHLAQSPDVPVRPSSDRPIEEIEARLPILNGGASTQEIMEEVERIRARRPKD